MNEIPKNRVMLNEAIESSVNRIPFLKRFFVNNDPYYTIRLKILEYLGDGFTFNEFSSANINMLLIEAEKRGDL